MNHLEDSYWIDELESISEVRIVETGDEQRCYYGLLMIPLFIDDRYTTVSCLTNRQLIATGM